MVSASYGIGAKASAILGLDVFRYIWTKSSLLFKKLQFRSNISKYRLKNSKCGKVKPRSDIPWVLIKYQKF